MPWMSFLWQNKYIMISGMITRKPAVFLTATPKISPAADAPVSCAALIDDSVAGIVCQNFVLVSSSVSLVGKNILT